MSEVKLNHLTTERRNEKTMNLDTLSTHELLEIMNEEDHKVPEAVREAIPEIEKAVQAIIKALRSGGRLIYICLLYTSIMYVTGMQNIRDVIPFARTPKNLLF